MVWGCMFEESFPRYLPFSLRQRCEKFMITSLFIRVTVWDIHLRRDVHKREEAALMSSFFRVYGVRGIREGEDKMR